MPDENDADRWLNDWARRTGIDRLLIPNPNPAWLAQTGVTCRRCPVFGVIGQDGQVIWTPSMSDKPCEHETPPRFTCPRCRATSWNPNDAEQGYCGRCHAFTGRARPAPGGREVMVEVLGDTGEWLPAGTVSEAEPPGSLASVDATGRQVYLFGFIDGHPGVWRRTGGVDFGTGAEVAVVSAALERLSDLTGAFQLQVTPVGRTRTIRFSLVDTLPPVS